MSETDLDVLAFAAHPDDAEMGCGGTLASLAQRGYRVGVADLTLGELASRGTPDERQREAQEAAAVLCLAARENLKLPDGGLRPEPAQLQAVVECLRRHRPALVLAPHPAARHPDHRGAARLVEQACFLAGLRRYRPERAPFMPRRVLFYGERYALRPAFVVDVSAVYDRKLKALSCYRSQLYDPSAADQPNTLIGAQETLAVLEARDRSCGALAGVSFAEAFTVRESLAIDDPVEFFRSALPAHVFPAREDG
ncbi:MAG TPA: bacillithiol biosynthesis deacetylase BshB1 [Acidobacteriota bacterium]